MRSSLRVLALVGVLAIAALAAVVLHRSFDMPLRNRDLAGDSARGAGAPSGAPDGRFAKPRLDRGDGVADSGEDVVARALRLAAIDTTKKKEWVEDIPDLDLASLSPGAREVFLRIANGRRCRCGCGFTLAGCRRFDSECDVSGPRAQALFDSVRTGKVASAEGFPERPARR